MHTIRYRNNNHQVNHVRANRKITSGADSKRSIVVPDRSTRIGGPERGVESTRWAVLHINITPLIKFIIIIHNEMSALSVDNTTRNDNRFTIL